jgi:hypothetical protein
MPAATPYVLRKMSGWLKAVLAEILGDGKLQEEGLREIGRAERGEEFPADQLPAEGPLADSDDIRRSNEGALHRND